MSTILTREWGYFVQILCADFLNFFEITIVILVQCQPSLTTPDSLSIPRIPTLVSKMLFYFAMATLTAYFIVKNALACHISFQNIKFFLYDSLILYQFNNWNICMITVSIVNSSAYSMYKEIKSCVNHTKTATVCSRLNLFPESQLTLFGRKKLWKLKVLLNWNFISFNTLQFIKMEAKIYFLK